MLRLASFRLQHLLGMVTWALLPLLATVAAHAQTLWYSTTTRTERIDVDTRQVQRSLPLVSVATGALPDGGAWLLGIDDRLRRIDAGGTVSADLSVGSLFAPLADGSIDPRLAVDPVDRSVWLAFRSSFCAYLFDSISAQLLPEPGGASPGMTCPTVFARVSVDGQVSARATVNTVGWVRDFAVDRHRRLWLLTADAVQVRGLDGTTSRTVRLIHPPLAGRLALDAHAALAYYTGGSPSTAGTMTLEMTDGIAPLSLGAHLVRVDPFGAPGAQQVALPVQAQPLAVDPRSGQVWVASPEGLRRLSADGLQVHVTVPGQVPAWTWSLPWVVDPASGAFWTTEEDEGQAAHVNQWSESGASAGALAGALEGSLSVPPLQVLPSLAFEWPAADAAINQTLPEIAFRQQALCNGKACTVPISRLPGWVMGAAVNGQAVPAANLVHDEATARTRLRPATPLADGPQVATATAADALGQTLATASRGFRVDTQPPVIGGVTPASGSRLTTSAVTVGGTVSEPSTIRIGGQARNGMSFAIPLTLAPGANAVELRVVDEAGNVTVWPLVYHRLVVETSAPAEGATVSGPSVEVTGTYAGPEDTRITVNGVSATLGAGTYTATVPLPPGSSTLQVTLDSGGVTVTRTIQVTRDADGGFAPPAPDPSVATGIADSTAFLHTGANAPQRQVQAGLIRPERVAVVRGRVLDRSGAPLPGVTVSVLGQPGLGHTLTRADGGYGLAVNGGESLVLNFDRPGHLPAQRRHQPRWNRWLVANDVVLPGLDPAVTTVQLGPASTAQVARGSVMSDADGMRRASVYFPPGTSATLRLPDGRTQAIGTLNVRATEYTVGPAGRAAMPGDLPPASAYTYAVELSVDEAIAAGATEVRFSRPVPFYVDNFLGFPVGMSVPVGWYDRQQGRWVPADNGRVVKVLAVAGGRAQVDTDGDGLADNAGIDDAEAQVLAGLFGAGDTLWRTPVDHFTAYDCNWPWVPPPGAAPGGGPAPPPGGCSGPGLPGNSTIHCGRQALEERIALAGVPFDLVYDSARAGPVSRRLELPISGDSLPPGLQRVDVVTTVAGRSMRQSHPPQAGRTHRVEWDGLDGYGRTVNGAQPATVRVGYVYKPVYATPAEQARAFGAAGTTPISGSPGRGEITLWRDFELMLGAISPAAAGLGGWVPDVLKAYDPQLHAVAGAAGDAQTEQATTGRTLRARVLTRVGPAVSSLSVDRAGNAYVHDAGAGAVKRIDEAGTTITVAAAGPEVSAVHVAADGTVYLAARPTAGTPFHHIIRQRPDGQRDAVVGAPSGLPDDGPAAQVRLMGPVTFLTTGPTGELYWVERLGQSSCAAPSTGRDRLRELTVDGQVVTRMGRPCQAAGPLLDWPFELAYAPVPAARQAVGPTRTGWVDFGPIGIVAVAPDGSLLVSHKVVPPGDSLATQLISVIGSDGWLRRRAGGVRWLDDPRGGDGMPLDDPMSRVNLHDDPIALTAEGDILVAEGGGGGYTDPSDGRGLHLPGKVRLLDAETIRTVAGGGSVLQDGDALAIRLGGPVPAGEPKGYLCNLWNGQEPGFTLPGFASPTASGPYCPRWLSIATHPAGGFVVLDTRDGGAVVRVAPPHVLAATGAERRVPSRSGDELHVFDPRGRHLRTVKAQGGATVWQFGYDAQGALLTVTDGSGNSTRIERDAQGRPQAVVSPFGLRSTLTVDATGHLQRVTSPLGHVHEAVHGADGLLRSFRVPGGRLATMNYDTAGRLTADQNDAGGGWQLARVELPTDTQPDPDTVRRTSGHAVTARSAEGRQDTYLSEFLGDGSLRHTTAAADGSVHSRLLAADGGVQSLRADGSVLRSTRKPHPRLGLFSPLHDRTLTLPSGLVIQTIEEATVSGSDLAQPVDEVRRTQVNGRTTTWHYSAATREHRITSPAGRSQAWREDAAGRVVQREVGGLAAIHYAYDDQGRVVLQTQGSGNDARRTQFFYGNDGLLSGITDALGRSLSLQRDAAGRVVQGLLPGARTIGFVQDPNGNLVSLTPPGRPAHTIGHDRRDLETHYTPPLLPGVASPQHTKVYNLDKDLTLWTLADGRSLSLGYDATSGQLRTLTPGTDGGPPVTLGYHPSGQLASASTPEQGLGFSYDGPLPLHDDYTGAVQARLSRRYDADARLVELTVGGSAVTLSYDADDLLTQAGPLGLVRDPVNGRLAGITLGQTTSAIGHNPFGEPTLLVVEAGGNPVYRLELSHDALGRVVATTETVLGQTRWRDYGYDEAGRLATIASQGTPLARIGYDANGNRTRLDQQTVAQFDDQDRLVQQLGVQFSFNDAGQLRARTDASGTTHYRYDLWGRLMEVTRPDGRRIAYVYDAAGRRVARKVDGQTTHRWVWQDSLRIAAEVDAAGSTVARYIHGDRPNVPEAMLKNGRTWRLVSDHLGSVRLVIDATTGQVAQRIDYDEWGQVLSDSNPGFQPFGYAGGLYDPDTGLVRFGARDYDAATGRWTTKDPIGFGGGDSNLYGYVAGNPIGLVDPDGRLPIVPIVSVVVGAGYAAYQGYKAGKEWGKMQCQTSDRFNDRANSPDAWTPAQRAAQRAEQMANAMQTFGPITAKGIFGVVIAFAGTGGNPVGAAVAGVASVGGVYHGRTDCTCEP